MTTLSLEERVTRLEKLIGATPDSEQESTGGKDWQKTVGMFRNDPYMKEIIDEALRLREEERQRCESEGTPSP